MMTPYNLSFHMSQSSLGYREALLLLRSAALAGEVHMESPSFRSRVLPSSVPQSPVLPGSNLALSFGKNLSGVSFYTEE